MSHLPAGTKMSEDCPSRPGVCKQLLVSWPWARDVGDFLFSVLQQPVEDVSQHCSLRSWREHQ